MGREGPGVTTREEIARRDEIIRQHYATLGPEETARLAGCSYQTVIKRAAKLGVFLRRRWSADEERELARLYHAGKVEEAAERFGLTPRQVMDKVYRDGIQKADAPPESPNPVSGRDLDEAFFADIRGENAAYWFGYLWGGASVVRSDQANRSKVSLTVEDRDLDLVNRFLVLIRSSARPKPSPRRQSASTVEVFSRSMVDRLLELGLGDDAYRRAGPPPVPDGEIRHFTRGLFDSAGSVSDRGTNPYFSVAHTEGTCRWLVEKAGPAAGVGGWVGRAAGGNLWRWELTGRRQILAVSAWLYEGATVWLARHRAGFDRLADG